MKYMKRPKRHEAVIEGMTVVRSKDLEREKKKGCKEQKIPTKFIVKITSNVRLSHEQCGGDIEKCQYLCGACMQDPMAPLKMTTRFERKRVLNTEKYLKQLAQIH